MTSDSDSEEAYIRRVGTHKAGSITRIKLHNFLTYSDVEFRPGPRLNMVIGPNGTGKSSILNAICFGLGGEPKLLGRADDARAFIAHGKDHAEIEIELAPLPGKGTHVFRRTIDRHKGSEKGKGRGASQYFVNDEKVHPNVIREIVSEDYNIAIDNLCTFLPQDKVGSFSGFDSKQLLQETEKTLSTSQHLYRLHMDLIQAEAELQSGVVNVDTIKSKLKKLEHENKQLEQEKMRVEEREEALVQAEVLEKKRIWLQVDVLREEAVSLKEAKTEVKDRLKAAHAELAPLQEEQQRLAKAWKEADLQLKVLEMNKQKCNKEMEKQLKKYENHDDGIEEALAMLRELDTKHEEVQARYRSQEERVATLEEQLSSFATTEEEMTDQYNEAREAARVASRAYESAKRELARHLEKAHLLKEKGKEAQMKLAKMNDEGARRKERIFRQERNLGQIFEWLESNRDKFRRPVWGPVACEVATKDQNTAAALEQHVPNWVLKSFVVENKEDYDFLFSEIRERRKIPINIVNTDGQRLSDPQRPYSEEKMSILQKEYAIAGYLDHYFTAPDQIMLVLRKQAAVHKVLMGGEETNQKLTKLTDFISEPDISLGQTDKQPSVLFCSDNGKALKFSNVVSRYSKEISSRQDDISQARLLAPGVNPRVKKEAEDRIAEANAEMNELRPAIEDSQKEKNKTELAAQEVKAKLQSSKQSLESLKKFQQKLENARNKLDDARRDLESDDEKEKKALVQSLMNRVAHGVSALEVHAQQHEQMLLATMENAGLQISRNDFSVAERRAKYVCKNTSFKGLETRAVKIQTDFMNVKKEYAKLKTEAERVAPLEDENGNKTELFDQLQELEVTTLHDCEAALDEAVSKADEYADNPDALRQYERTKAEIEEVQTKLDDLTSSKDAKLQEIRNKSNPWQAALENYVSKVDKLFSEYMQEMECTGEIRLKRGKIDEDDENQIGNFKDWGIEILVSFREGTKAQILSAQVQSGGERSVSTIMYLMALQDMMVAPFRCVDEINQGLDDRNERLVFRRIVENSTRPPKGEPFEHVGQYFLITPKLLPNLVDMEEEGVTILFVFNGEGMHQSIFFYELSHLTLCPLV
ncbi:predicted protein [Phaeodactylum tricornutum CCAP 1055/1]|uniref:Structural maintenance of chromosomes protein 5 n=1 Tax=Phaeodactylum tricornutum (strain CCAP 1055/1) TaxID=556484 RepID=B5Y5D5_PHATC|nr:predicted protein [Phaeodactylum tricornutum CCAP 1055/1]ACI65917.1 predicted protein [Phaeodactylum tricornutum CCAP 1055/1]|eukprot:XP_002186447.1 predicted protein [Phaeodactylum tricornutum CCAP 1055/1]